MSQNAKRIEGQNNISGENISDYPAHVESFETYYFLAEHRSIKETALIRFPQYVPNCPPNDPNFETKFASFYRKLKRWAKAEDWNEWVKRKEIEERQRREEEMMEKTAHLSQVIKNYQDFVRKSLAIFANKAKLPVLLEEAIAQGDSDAEAEIRNRINRGEGVEVKNFKEANEMIKLDLFLVQTMEQLPQIESTDRCVLSETEAKKIDDIMEFIRRHAKDM
jgi:hypothetical protein